MTKVLIIGAGYIGMELADRCSPDLFDITILKRKPITTQHKSIFTELMGDSIDVPYHDLIVFCLPPGKNTEHYHAIIHSVCKLNKTNDSQMIFISSTGVYDQNDPAITEKTIIQTQTDRAERLFVAENMITASFDRFNIIRPSRIYGPNRMGMHSDVVNKCVRHYPDNHISHHIHRDDLVNIILTAMKHDDFPKICIASDPNPQPTNLVYQWLSQKTGIPLTHALSDGSNLPLHSIRKIIPEALIQNRFSFAHPDIYSGYNQLIK